MVYESVETLDRKEMIANKKNNVSIAIMLIFII